MSDETDIQKADAERAASEAAKASAEASKAAAESTTPVTPTTAVAAGKPGVKAEKPPRSNKERILIGLVACAALGLIWAVFHLFSVMRDAQNPYAQGAGPAGRPASEAELEQEEAKFQPKNVAPIPQDSAVMHEHANAMGKPAAKPGAKPAAAKAAKH